MFCVWSVLKTPSFLLSPILQHEGIANQRQNVLMTVRASSARGMSSKKKLPADCSNLFSAPDRGSFGASNSYALWPFGPPREPSQLMCFLMPCIASKFHAMSFFPIPNLFRILFRNFKSGEKAQDILRFIDFVMVSSMNGKISCVFFGMHSICSQFARKIKMV